MEVEKSVLDTLKCFQCRNVLSCAPVMLKTDGKSVCGRCESIQPKNCVRNEAYENLALAFVFPCMNQKNGCSAILQMDHVLEHEKKCLYTKKSYVCPTTANDKSCSWMGKLEDIETHFQSYHPELIVDHPFSNKPDITKNSVSHFIFRVYGFLFLLQVKCNAMAGQIWHTVLFLGDPMLSYIFSFDVSIFNKKNNLTKSNTVCCQGKLNIYDENSTRIILSNILSDFGPYSDINIKVSVTMSETKCYKCDYKISSAPIYPSSSGFYCGACKEEEKIKISCQNRLRGCRYEQEDKRLLKKHEYWLCEHRSSKCRWCSKDLENVSTMHHYEIHHHKIIKADQKDNDAIVKFEGLINVSQSFIVKAHNMTFNLSYNFEKNIVNIVLTSDQNESACEIFHVKYKVTCAGKSIRGVLDTKNSDCLDTFWLVSDWMTSIFVPHTHLCKNRATDAFDLELTIVKNIDEPEE